MQAVDAAAFLAAGMRGPIPRASEAPWGIWTLRRLHARLSTMLDAEADPDLVVASALLDGTHALLSGLVHRLHGDAESHGECITQARDDVAGALKILKRS